MLSQAMNNKNINNTELNLDSISSLNIEVALDIPNKRLKVFNPKIDYIEGLINYIIKKGVENDIHKLIVYGDNSCCSSFLDLGFTKEAMLCYFYEGSPAYILTKYLNKNRSISKTEKEANAILDKISAAKNILTINNNLDQVYTIRDPKLSELPQLAKLYRSIFSSYPTPVGDINYLTSTVQTGSSIYKIVVYNNRIVSAAAAEVDHKHRTVEMTDCLTLSEYRGKGLMRYLIKALEKEVQLRYKGYSIFSMARSTSKGMNYVLYSMGYRYQGRLINNSHICGKFEDFNVWEK